MNSSIRLKQTIIIGAILLLVAFLFTRDIKGLVKPTEENGKMPSSGQLSESASVSSSGLSIQTTSEAAKNVVAKSLATDITALENSYKSATGADKVELAQQLAQKWDDVNLPVPAAFYDELIASAESNYSNWIKTGNKFTDAYQNAQDSLTQPALVQKAIAAYQKAAELKPGSLEAKTGLGIAYVSGTPNPMQGIQLLLEVVKQEPDNIKANMNLGLFSMKSGQYEKAVNRFKTVIAQKPEPEVWFYLASAYENLGNKEEAITAYLQSKELAADPKLGEYVDSKIQELRK